MTEPDQELLNLLFGEDEDTKATYTDDAENWRQCGAIRARWESWMTPDSLKTRLPDIVQERILGGDIELLQTWNLQQHSDGSGIGTLDVFFHGEDESSRVQVYSNENLWTGRAYASFSSHYGRTWSYLFELPDTLVSKLDAILQTADARENGTRYVGRWQSDRAKNIERAESEYLDMIDEEMEDPEGGFGGRGNNFRP